MNRKMTNDEVLALWPQGVTQNPAALESMEFVQATMFVLWKQEALLAGFSEPDAELWAEMKVRQ